MVPSPNGATKRAPPHAAARDRDEVASDSIARSQLDARNARAAGPAHVCQQ